MRLDTPIRVVIVDDSRTARAAIRAALELDKGIGVVGEANSAEEATRLVQRLRPNLVTMDVYLAGTTGIEVTRSIMAACPTPILVVTAYHPTDPALAFKAIEAGALDVCTKLPSPRSAEYEREQKRLVRLVHALSRVPVVRRYALRHRAEAKAIEPALEVTRSPELIAIGASTGGPPVVRELLRALPPEYATPIVLVQHITQGFGESYAQWLSEETCRPVNYVRDRARLSASSVFMAADNRHLRLTPGHWLVASDEAPVNYQRPSIDVFFSSVARELSSRAVAVLLTGMGSDGAAGLGELKMAGALTIAQAPDSCAVDGMPSSAIRQGAAELILRPDSIAEELRRLQRDFRRVNDPPETRH